MDTILFSIADYPVTLAMALLGGLAVAALVFAAVIIAVTSGNARQAAETGARFAEQLRESFTAQLGERDRRIQELDHQVRVERERGAEQAERLQEKNSELLADASALRARMTEQVAQAQASEARFLAARQQMTDEFKAIAGDVLKNQSETFTKQNREQVDTLLKPLNDKIGEFHTGLIKDRATMGEQIRALLESNVQITTEASNLTKALKGNAQTQGAWGEMILSTILERSGLREGEQYVTQQSHIGTDGSRLRTDVEILMPNDDRLVIDSKVSLTAFEAYTNCEDETRDSHLRAHIVSVRGHIRTLGEKTYQKHARSSLDYVMMFVPIESALATAIQADATLVEYGMSQGVMLTTPTTLMTVLRTVRNVWDIEKRHRNADEIAERAGALYEKVAGFLASMDKLDGHLEKARLSFEDAKGQLSTGRGNVVRQVEMLRDLGAKSNKTLPSGWDGGSEDAPVLRIVGKDEPGDLA
ncbi:DNA recombination protein RmuC [Devosia sp. YR412]|uniref:DNA recombination protein RmuC n=1 Tax=Devosia sp. YR412 TaxID=1881030 RepID=UPI0008B5E3C5|nr:DNA recombination protein RmuC [Devosia sp. YR412]SEP70409.1 DNA recombination protein RmuC [Devosia sp. YR412]